MLVGGRATEVAARAALTLRPHAIADAGRGASTTKKIVAIAAVLAFNVALFLVPIDYSGLGAFAYAGAFLITLIANAAVVVPVPYIPIVAHVVASAELPVVVILLAALGSAIGESVAFAVGRVERDLLTGHPWAQRMSRFFSHEWRAAVFLFFFAIPLNPVFDIGGLFAGALGISFRTFFGAVLLGRVLRFTIIGMIAVGVLGVLSLR